MCSTENGFFWEENLLVQSHKSSAFEVADGVCKAARGLLAVSAFLGDRRRLRREPTTRLAEAGPCPQCADYGVLIISEYGNHKQFNWSLSPIQLILVNTDCVVAEAGPCPQCADYGVLIITGYGKPQKVNWSLSPIQLILVNTDCVVAEAGPCHQYSST